MALWALILDKTFKSVKIKSVSRYNPKNKFPKTNSISLP